MHEHASASFERRLDEVNTFGEGNKELSLFVGGWYLGVMQGEPFNIRGWRSRRCYAQDVRNGMFPKGQFYVFPTRWEVTANREQECTYVVSVSLGRDIYEVYLLKYKRSSTTGIMCTRDSSESMIALSYALFQEMYAGWSSATRYPHRSNT